VTDGADGAYAVAACAFSLPSVLSTAHIALNTSLAAKVKIAARDTSVVAPLLCKIETIVLPDTFVPFTRGQNLKATSLADELLICAVKATSYKPPSRKVISVKGDPVRVMPSDTISSKAIL
jgi:hypothetical protein